jgi:hypothetical protein
MAELQFIFMTFLFFERLNMKKLLVVLSLAMASFSFSASAATLSWGTISGTSALQQHGGNGQELFGSEIGLAKNVNVNATWKFTLDALSGIIVNISSLKVNPTWLTTVTLDNIALTQIGTPANGAWLFEGVLGAGEHIINLAGITNGTNSGYQLNVETPIPAAIWLFGSALMGLTGISRRIKA